MPNAVHIYTYVDPPRERDLQSIARILSESGVIAYPSDGNWAFACDAADVRALDRIRMLKPTHPKDQPFSLICADISMASSVANIDSAAYPFLKKAMPGPYTILLERNRSLPRQIKDKRKIVGIRIPASKIALEIVKFYGKPLATTSVPGARDEDGVDIAPTFGYQVFETFGHGIDMVVDLGDEVSGGESTIIDLSTGSPELVRMGIGDPSIFGLEAPE